MAHLHPIETSAALEQAYRSYLLTTFRFRDGEVQERFAQQLRAPGTLTKGPFLEATPPFATGETLADFPDITFGRFTGDTETDPGVARDRFAETHPGQAVLPNERLSREEMRQAPPHILLTNFAMLEYMLLRPQETPFFDDARFAGHWRFVVLDEAHTYSGAKGTEIAMLLRRLKERIVSGETGRLRCIATSATLGRGPEDAREVADFASNLFGETFDWIDGDPKRQDVVFARHRRKTAASEGRQWPKPVRPYYVEFQRAWTDASDDLASILRLLRDAAVPEAVVDRFAADGEALLPVEQVAAAAQGPLRHTEPKPAVPSDGAKGRAQALFRLLSGDPAVDRLRRMLAEGPWELREAAARLWPNLDRETALAHCVALVDLATAAKQASESAPLLSARYHFFVGATEGAFIRFVPDLQMYLNRRTEQEGTVFEAASCFQCGQLHIVGRVDEQERLVLPDGRTDPDIFMVGRDAVMPDEDDEDEQLVDGGDVDKFHALLLCGWCGRLHPMERLRADGEQGQRSFVCCDERAHPAWRTVWHTPRTATGRSRCGSCGTRRQDPVRRVLVGQDAAVAVLSTKLYERLPARMSPPADGTPREEQRRRSSWRGRRDGDRRPEAREGARRLLTFSDSRHEAAYFSWYLQSTHNDNAWRQAILQVARELQARFGADVALGDMVQGLTDFASAHGMYLDASTAIDKEKKTWKYLLREFRFGYGVAGLESVGLITFRPMKNALWTDGWEEEWNLTKEQALDLWALLLDGFRLRGAVAMPDIVSPTDEFFAPVNRHFYFREQAGRNLRGTTIFSWRPKERAQNARTDVLRRVLARQGVSGAEADRLVEEALQNTWLEVVEHQTADGLMGAVTEASEGTVYHTIPSGWHVVTDATWGRCNRCGTWTSRHRLGVCPVYRCTGDVVPADPEVELAGDHYRQLYEGAHLHRMRVEEHTAHLDSRAAQSLQKQFEGGRVNVLSCSTTFEMGVDVGELEAVLLRNVPPEPSNYVQRAGRAGRRSDATAYVLTYAQRRSHDAAYYHDPIRMIAGQIRPPGISLRNEKILKRHLYATVLSWYFRRRREQFADLSTLEQLVPDEDPYLRVRDLHRLLQERPPDLMASLELIFPEGFLRKLQVRAWQWVDAFCSPDPVSGSDLYDAVEDLHRDLQHIDEVRRQRFQADRPIDHLGRLRTTLTKRDIISFLSTKNVLPKYGFPVDTVNLEIKSHMPEARRLELSRDLRLAVGEYAPGSEVVAGGYVWTSYALKRPPRRAWEVRRYAVCDKCSAFTDTLLIDIDEPLECVGCGSPIDRPREYVIPRFGFMTQANPRLERPKQTRPRRAYASRVYFSGFESEVPGDEEDAAGAWSLGDGGSLLWRFSARGRLAVVNAGPGNKGYRLCRTCGFAEPTITRQGRTAHNGPWGEPCSRPNFGTYHLGHNFTTDVMALNFPTSEADGSFWLSLTYALLEGVSAALDVDRSDLDGCVYYEHGSMSRPTVVLFDDVPGGAGHTKRIASESELSAVLQASLARVARCRCGDTTSCYGCLRNYSNQWCHEQLRRGPVVRYLDGLLANGR